MAASTRWRLNISANDGDASYLSICEMEMRASDGGADQCSGGTADQSSQYSVAYSGEKAFDDDTGTHWVTSFQQTTGWIEYEFASSVEVWQYAIKPQSAYLTRAPNTWTLEYWDGDSWETADSRSGESSWTGGVFNVYSTAGDSLDGKVFVYTGEWINSADGKVAVQDKATDLLDGEIEIIDPATALLDGFATVLDKATDNFDGVIDVPLMVTTGQWAWKGIAPASQWALPADTPHSKIYIATLRKTGFDDVEVPIKSLQLRRRSGNPTMVSVVIPDALTYLGYATDREGGEIIIQSGSETDDETRHLSELERATLENISYDRGVNSSSLTVGGYRTETNENPRTVALEAITYYGLQADGKRRVRGPVNMFLRPGDIAVVGVEQITVEQIYIAVDTLNGWMEITG